MKLATMKDAMSIFLRNSIAKQPKLLFANLFRLAALSIVGVVATFNIAQADMLDVEKDELKFGFIKLTDMAPLAIAYEKGYFEDEGLFVTLEAQANWKVCLIA